MSRIGRKIINLPTGVTWNQTGRVGTVVGPRGKLEITIPLGVTVVVDGQNLKIECDEGLGNLQGLTRTLIFNAVSGTTTDWKKTLELTGTGYRASTNGTELNLALGFSHPVVVRVPADSGMTFEVNEGKITVCGRDRELVGRIAAKIRGLRPADPYKLKGLKYEGEKIIKKAGKAAKAGASGGK